MPARYEIIASWVNQRNWTKGAELGIFDGATHLYLLKNCPKLELIGVDVWDLPGFKEGPTKSGEKCFCTYCNGTRKARKAETVTQMRERVTLTAAVFLGRSKLLQMTTTQAAWLVDDHSLDFVFVDGDHSQEGVAADIENWRPKLKPGGVIFGHDYNMKSVRDAVASELPGIDVVLGDDHLWIVTPS